jgi:undecaprenyl diphosphate synthase
MNRKDSSAVEQLSIEELAAKLEPDLLPKHIAIIMDGNGRWAEPRNLPRIAGHREGIKSVREMITVCLELGIHALTIYAFSQENWNRPRQEISSLMGLLEYYLSTERAKLIEQGVRLRTIGRLDSLPPSALQWVRAAEQETAHLDRLHLTVALSYSGRTEIVDAVRELLHDVQDGKLQPDDVDESCIQQYLYTHDLPDPDLLIRTSGETRISNFLLWQLAYTELYISPVLWPDFGRQELYEAIREYQSRDRRFGRVAP